MQNFVLRAYLIFVMGVYIIFETLHVFSTCYQDMHVDSLIVSPGYFFKTFCSYVTDEALTVRYF